MCFTQQRRGYFFYNTSVYYFSIRTTSRNKRKLLPNSSNSKEISTVGDLGGAEEEEALAMDKKRLYLFDRRLSPTQPSDGDSTATGEGKRELYLSSCYKRRVSRRSRQRRGCPGEGSGRFSKSFGSRPLRFVNHPTRGRGEGITGPNTVR
jgi:hypothetical protein